MQSSLLFHKKAKAYIPSDTDSIDPIGRFYHLFPAVERAVKRAVWSCQPSDQEDAVQVGLMEVWTRLQDPVCQRNTDSWFICRAVAYGRDYVQRLVYRYQQRNESMRSFDDDGEAATLPVNEPATDGALNEVDDRAYLDDVTAQLASPIQRQIAVLLARGEKKTEIAQQTNLSYKQVIRQCKKIAATLASR